jgi:hypothetical protein
MATFKANEIVFHATSYFVVIGHDPEFADYSNPRGERYGFACYVRAVNEFGDARELYVTTTVFASDGEAKAEKVAAALTNRARGGKLPVGFDNWSTARPVYGSEAYESYGRADDLAMEARELADEAWA